MDEPFLSRAVSLDRADPLAAQLDAFVAADGVVAYLDGNSLGRPLKVTAERMRELIVDAWGERLIRSWDEGWIRAPTELGDLIARLTLGAAPGQTVVGDSTTVQLYKLLRAAVSARPERDVIVTDSRNFPTDRYIAEGVAAERGLQIRWLEPDPCATVTEAQLRERLDERVAAVTLSHVDYRSGAVADMGALTAAAHEAGALMLWDLCHSVGALELALDRHDVDLAVGCTYKYLNGGPGAPAFAYVAARLQEQLRHPIQGWLGVADPFAMGPAFVPADGIARFISGTPPIVAMLPMRDMLELIGQVGMPAIREKSVALTEFAIAFAEERLAPLGVTLASPRQAEHRGSHVLLEHPDFRALVAECWQRGVIPDFREPQGLRIGLSPLSTSFTELLAGLSLVEQLLAARGV